MAKFTDKQVLCLLKLKIDELYNRLSPSSELTHDERLFDAGRRSVLDSLTCAINFYQDYVFDDLEDNGKTGA